MRLLCTRHKTLKHFQFPRSWVVTLGVDGIPAVVTTGTLGVEETITLESVVTVSADNTVTPASTPEDTAATVS